MNALKRLARAIEQNESFLITAHVNMDGDALGSSAALALALINMGKRCFFKGEGAFPGQLSDISGIRRLLELPELEEYDAAIAVDCADIGRLGIYAPLFSAARLKLVIDHHVTNQGFGDINYIKSCPATAQCVYELFMELGLKAEGETAECLYTAFLTDTGRFAHSDVGRDTMLIAAQLYDAGFDTARINKLLFGTRTFNASRLLGRALNSLELCCENKIAIISITQRDFDLCGAHEADSEGIVNYALEVAGVEAAVFLRQRGEGYKVSLRSSGRLDVSEIALLLGGGGHRMAAGCVINGSLEEAKRQIADMISGRLVK